MDQIGQSFNKHWEQQRVFHQPGHVWFPLNCSRPPPLQEGFWCPFSRTVFTLGSRAVAVFLIKNHVCVRYEWRATTREWRVMSVKKKRERVEEFKCNDRVVFRHQTEFIIKRLTWGGRSAESGGLFRFYNFPLPFSFLFFCIPSHLGLLCSMIILGFFFASFYFSAIVISCGSHTWNICSDEKLTQSLNWNEMTSTSFVQVQFASRWFPINAICNIKLQLNVNSNQTNSRNW